MNWDFFVASMNWDFFAGWCACLIVITIRDCFLARKEKRP